MKKTYETPQLDITYFGTLDVLTDSSGADTGPINEFPLPGNPE